ncbi:hypothetical protein KSF78_0000686 [Schistosoma japonicum]|nr:hypothetical protein KSF78_0000686 [Schistosoma japonicum]
MIVLNFVVLHYIYIHEFNYLGIFISRLFIECIFLNKFLFHSFSSCNLKITLLFNIVFNNEIHINQK